MAKETQEQLVTVEEVAATLGCLPQKVSAMASKSIREWWTGAPAVTHAVARDISARYYAEKDKADAEYIKQFDRDRQLVADMEEAARARSAAQAGAPRVFGGVRTSFPGEGPERDWMKAPSEEVE